MNLIIGMVAKLQIKNVSPYLMLFQVRLFSRCSVLSQFPSQPFPCGPANFPILVLSRYSVGLYGVTVILSKLRIHALSPSHPLNEINCFGMFLHSAASRLNDRSKHTSSPGRPVHSGTNSTSLGSIQPCCSYCSYCMKNINSYPPPPLPLARYSITAE